MEGLRQRVFCSRESSTMVFCFVLLFAVLERSLCPLLQILLRINKVLALPR